MAIKAVQQIMLGTVTGREAQARETLATIRAAGYDGIELNGFMIHPTPFLVRALTKAAGMPTGKGGSLDWKRLLKESGLQVVSIHQDLGSIERDPKAVAKEAKEYGTGDVVITGMYRFDYGSADAVKDLCVRLNAAGKALKEEGVRLLYHNHNCEFIKTDAGARGYDLLIGNTDPEYLNFEFDSYWPSEAGVNALDVMKTLGTRMKLWHINDRGARVSGPVMTPILTSDSMELGTGSMDLAALAKQALGAGVDAVILESHKNWIDGSPVRSLEVSAAFMNEYIK